MKQTKKAATQQGRSARPGALPGLTRSGKSKVRRARAAVRAGRPLHKRLLLHPFSIMVILCAGVLFAGTTIRSLAAVNLDVTATVPAPLATSPAVITLPADQQHFSVAETTISGTCPPQTYIKLYRNGNVSGVSQCGGSTFQIQTGLSPGANQLQAQVYNLTDQAGPAGATITLYYDPVVSTPPAAPADAPTTMWVSSVEDATYKQGKVLQTSDNPTVSGFAPPWSIMTITFHSDPQICRTQANGMGWWSCTLDHPLPGGMHHVDVRAVTPAGAVLTVPTFEIRVTPGLASLLKPLPAGDPLLVRADYHYRVYLGHQSTDLAVGVTGGTTPYHVTADWGDGATSSLDRTDTVPFTFSHTYATPNGANKEYIVLVRATDARGQKALMQLSVVVKGNGILLVSSTTPLGALLDSVQHWLWLIWPAYVVVVLMAIGYYLGEREEYRHLMAKKRNRIAGARAK